MRMKYRIRYLIWISLMLHADFIYVLLLLPLSNERCDEQTQNGIIIVFYIYIFILHDIHSDVYTDDVKIGSFIF